MQMSTVEDLAVQRLLFGISFTQVWTRAGFKASQSFLVKTRDEKPVYLTNGLSCHMITAMYSFPVVSKTTVEEEAKCENWS